MPQLDFTTFAPQLFWLAVSFVVLYGLMRWLALPRVEQVLAGRREHLAGDLTRAADLKTEAEAALAAYQKTLADARAAAQATLRETTEKLAAEAAARQQELSATLAAQVAAAEARIAAMKEQALADVRGIATEVGGAVVEKLIGATADAAKLRTAVEHAAERAW
jgi:F-type H+-transporting ATPase subunit b